MRLVILEGGRGTGKSTIARTIREKISEVTLINPTGFHLDGQEGLDKISRYYFEWLDFLMAMQEHDSTFVFDRFFFSERVFSELYKDYDFTYSYDVLMDNLHNMADEVDVIFFTIENEDELKSRLLRDKVPFGKADESVVETIRQQNLYKLIMSDLEHSYTTKQIRLHRVDTSNKTLEEIQTEVFKIIKKEES